MTAQELPDASLGLTGPSTPAPARERCEVHCLDQAKVNRGKDLLLNDDAYFELAETFRTLADSSRAKIVYSLLHQELCTCDLATIVGLSDSAVSQHLRVLRMLRVVKSRREGKMVFHSLDDSHVRILLNVALNHSQHGRHSGEASELGSQKDLVEHLTQE